MIQYLAAAGAALLTGYALSACSSPSEEEEPDASPIDPDTLPEDTQKDALYSVGYSVCVDESTLPKRKVAELRALNWQQKAPTGEWCMAIEQSNCYHSADGLQICEYDFWDGLLVKGLDACYNNTGPCEDLAVNAIGDYLLRLWGGVDLGPLPVTLIDIPGDSTANKASVRGAYLSIPNLNLVAKSEDFDGCTLTMKGINLITGGYQMGSRNYALNLNDAEGPFTFTPSEECDLGTDPWPLSSMSWTIAESALFY